MFFHHFVAQMNSKYVLLFNVAHFYKVFEWIWYVLKYKFENRNLYEILILVGGFIPLNKKKIKCSFGNLFYLTFLFSTFSEVNLFVKDFNYYKGYVEEA